MPRAPLTGLSVAVLTAIISVARHCRPAATHVNTILFALAPSSASKADRRSLGDQRVSGGRGSRRPGTAIAQPDAAPLLNESDRDRVAVELTVARFDRCHDDEDGIENPEE